MSQTNPQEAREGGENNEARGLAKQFGYPPIASQPQAGAAVASIEYTPGSWFEARTLDEMQAFYMSRLPAIREAAKEHGYAIGLHGTTRRDFDLMAMQWRESASDKDTLAHAIAVAACGITRDGAYQWERKPSGRFAVSLPICWTDHANPEFGDKPSLGHIDLSVIATPAPTDTGAAGAGEVKPWQERVGTPGFELGNAEFCGDAAKIAARDAEIADLRAQLARLQAPVGEGLSLQQVQAIRATIKSGDGWDGDDWDFALANAVAAQFSRQQAPVGDSIGGDQNFWQLLGQYGRRYKEPPSSEAFLKARSELIAHIDAQLVRATQEGRAYQKKVDDKIIARQHQDSKPTDLSKRLRLYIERDTIPFPRDILAACDEIERLAAAQGEPIGEVMAKPDNEHGNLTWPRVVWKDGLFALPPVGTKLYATPPSAQQEQGDDVRDSELLDFIEAECVTVECVSLPTPGGDDADVGFRIINYHMAEPKEREIGFANNPRDALRDAIRALRATNTEGKEQQ